LETQVSKLETQVENQDYKFDVFRQATDNLTRLATTIIITAGTVTVLANLGPSLLNLAVRLTELAAKS
jgi:hypothetical protein